MSVSKRTADAESDISTARKMPSTWESTAGVDRTRQDTQQVNDAERLPESHPGAPTKLPGYGGGK